jgi:hypothetical protein
VPEGPFNFAVRTPTCIVSVEGGEDVLWVHSVDEPNLFCTDSRSVDGESFHSDVPEGNGVDGSLNENHEWASGWRVVEEESSDINPTRIEVLWPVTTQCSTHNAKHLAPCSTERISDCVSLGVKAQSEGTRSSTSNTPLPVGVNVTCIPSGQPTLGVDTMLLHLGLEPGLHDLVVRFD